MNRKVISFLLIICMMLSLFPVSAFANDTTPEITWGGDGVKTTTSGSSITLTLNEDITTSQALLVTSGQSVILDLNGHALISSSTPSAIQVEAGGDLTIKDSGAEDKEGIIKATSNPAKLLDNKGKVTFESGTFEGDLDNDKDAELIINGGKFDTEGAPTATEIPNGKMFDYSDGYWALTDIVASIDKNNHTTSYASLQKAVDAVNYNSSLVKLVRDTTENITIKNKNIVLDLNGKTVTSKNEGTALFVENSTVKIKGNGTMIATGSALLLDYDNWNRTITLENGTFIGPFPATKNDRNLSILGGAYSQDPRSVVYTIKSGTKFIQREADNYYTLADITAEDATQMNFWAYPTLQDAIDAVPSDESSYKYTEITMLKDMAANINIKKGQNIRLDLNGCTLNNTSRPDPVITNDGYLYVTSLYETTDNTQTGAIVTTSSALLLVNNGSADFYDATYSGTLQNDGYLWINNGTYTSAGTVIINNKQLDISQGDFTGTLQNNANTNLTINGGNFTSTLQNAGHLEINNGTFTGALKNAENAGILIRGGYFKPQPDDAFLVWGYSFTPALDKDGYYTVINTTVKEDIKVAEPSVENPSDAPAVVVTAVKSLKPANHEDVACLENAVRGKVTEADKKAAVAKLNQEIPASIGKTATVVAVPYFDITIKDYSTEQKELKLDIKPVYLLKATTAFYTEDMVEEGTDKNTVTLGEAKPISFTNTEGYYNSITLALTLPNGFTANFVKHQKDAEADNTVHYYPVETNKDGVSSFKVYNGFSEFTFLTDNRKATICYNYSTDTDYSYEINYTIANVGASLPYRDNANGDTFIGWEIEGEIYTQFTEELLNLIDKIDGKTVKATAKYKANDSGSVGGGGSSSSSGGPVAPKAIVTSPDDAVKITYAGTSISLVNSVEKAVADNKNIQVVGGSSSSVSISAKKDGAVLNSFGDPFTATVPVAKSALNTVTDTSKLTLAKVTKAADGKITLTYMGGNYNEAKNNFTAYVDEPGNYVLLADNNIQKIALQVGKKTNTVNGKTVTNDVAPVIVNSRTMIPLRFVSESLGGKVIWNEATRAVTIKMNGLTMNMTIDQKIDGFDAAPVIRDGRTMVPVRYIAEKLGANVIYVPNTQEIVVVK